ALSPKNQDDDSPWTTVANVSITNNVIRNTGSGITLGFNNKTTADQATCQPLHDVTVRNNLIENLIAGATNGGGTAFKVTIGAGLAQGWNATIDHNTVLNVDHLMSFDAANTFTTIVASGLTFTNNVLNFGQAGMATSDGEGLGALNTYAP